MRPPELVVRNACSHSVCCHCHCLQGLSPLQAALVAGDKQQVLQEAAKVAQVGGRHAC